MMLEWSTMERRSRELSVPYRNLEKKLPIGPSLGKYLTTVHLRR